MLDGMLMSLNNLNSDQEDTATQRAPSFDPYSSNAQFVPGLPHRAHTRSKSSGATRSRASTPGSISKPSSASSNTPTSFFIRPLPFSHYRRNTLSQTHIHEQDIGISMGSEEGPDGAVSKATSNTSPDRRPAPTNVGPQRGESPSHDYDLNPHDRSRRRSRSFNAPVARSVLDRARPVPSEYHIFHNSTGSTSLATLQKSMSFPAPSQNTDDQARHNMAVARQHATREGLITNTNDLRGRDNHLGDVNKPPVGTISGSSGQPSSSFMNMNDPQMSAVGSKQPNHSAKERPGFFKRMFTSSKASAATLEALQQPPQLPPVQIENRHDTSGSRDLIEPGVQSYERSDAHMAAPVLPAANEDDPKQPARILHSKRSFFRRRKKTMSDKENATSSQDHSPSRQPRSDHPSMSSLRKVMDPYLAKEQAAGDKYFDSLEAQPARRNEPEDAYAFLRSTSPGRTQPHEIGGASGDEAIHAAPSRSHGHRPSTSAHAPHDRSHSKVMDEAQSTDRVRDIPDEARQGDTAPRPVTSPTFPQPNSNSMQDVVNRPTQPIPSEESHLVSPSRTKTQPTPPPIDVSAANAKTDQWLLHAPPDEPKTVSSKPSRVFIQEDASNEDLVDAGTHVPEDGHRSSLRTRAAVSDTSLANEDYASARSMPVVQVEGQDESALVSPVTATDYPSRTPSVMSQKVNERARRIWEAQTDPLTRDHGALELGEPGEAGDRLRIAFMAFFDFSGLNILLALRDLCGRMTLKGETQQMDRIVSAFSERWCECNPNHGFKNEDVVHTICYSLLLLNTDLHVADLAEKMTRTQFVRNTCPTLRKVAENAGSGTWPNSSHRRGSGVGPGPRSPSPSGTLDARPSNDDRSGTESRLSNSRLLRPTSEVPSLASPSPYDVHAVDASEVLVNAPHDGNMRSWEIALETVLKEFYLSIRQLRLPLLGATDTQLQEQPSSNNLSVMGSLMRRTGSIVSKAPSESSRGRASDSRSAASRWTSKTRARPRLYPASTLGSSHTASRTSLEEGSLFSPTASSIWSKSFGNTQTSMSTDSLASRLAQADPGNHQSVGFANALNHAIIREEGFTNPDESGGGGPAAVLEDEALELAGAPWAKEGIVQHKHLMETSRKTKGRKWSECFAVVEKGDLRLFSFNTGRSAVRKQKGGKSVVGGAVVVGGGNWLDSAQAVGTFPLRQTIASIMPPPGYSKARPHAFVLRLPNGSAHLFQVGTPEIAREFVSTVNYWSARLSKEPLVGGVSNVEYGWGDAVINTSTPNASVSATAAASSSASVRSMPLGRGNNPPSSFYLPRTDSSLSAPLAQSRTLPSSTASASLHSPQSSRSSLQGSLRSSFEAPNRPSAFRERTRLPADRLALAEWTPPQQSLMASTLSEGAQLEALRRYVKSVEEELERHNELRGAVVNAFSARTVNSGRAVGNWEGKSSYLLGEIVKFRTYIDVLVYAGVEGARVLGGGDGGEDFVGDGSVGAGNTLGTTAGAVRKVSQDEMDADDEELSEETREALRAAHLGRPRSGTESTR